MVLRILDGRFRIKAMTARLKPVCIPQSKIPNRNNPQSAISLPQLLGARRFDGSNNHGEDLVCFILQVNQQLLFHQPGFNNQFHPIHAFIALFLNNPHFGNEFGSGTSAAGCAVVGTNRRAASEQLFANHIGRLFLWQSFCQSDNPQGKSLCSVFEIFSVHGGKIERGHRICDFGFKQTQEIGV